MAEGALINCRLRAARKDARSRSRTRPFSLGQEPEPEPEPKTETESQIESEADPRKADVWRWRESLEPKGQANKVEEMQTSSGKLKTKS